MKANGKEQTILPGTTLEQFLEEHHFAKDRVAVERNGEILPSSVWEHVLLRETDTLEIVQFVGGG